MSDTPRTDAAIIEIDVAFVGSDGLSSSPEKLVEPEFARELERELAALRARVLLAEELARALEKVARASGHFDEDDWPALQVWRAPASGKREEK